MSRRYARAIARTSVRIRPRLRIATDAPAVLASDAAGMATTAPQPTLDHPAPTVVALPSQRPSRRVRLARRERPLLLTGLVLVTAHLLDLAFAGPHTTVAGVLAILAVPTIAAILQPHVTRLTRFALAVPIGLLLA